MESIQTAVILIGEFNPLIHVCGEPIITRQILRCKSFGIKKIFIFGHFTPEVLDYLKLNHAPLDHSIEFQFNESPWQSVLQEKVGNNILIISCEHFTDINFFKSSLSYQPEADEVFMLGDNDPAEFSTARPRILLTKNGQPVELLERGKGEAVWMGLTILGSKGISQLAQRKGEISHITFKQVSMISQYSQCKLINAKALFWDRIDSSLIGSDISQEVLYHANLKRNFINVWESGISQVITSSFNYLKSAIIPIYILLILFSLIGGWLLTVGTPWAGFAGLGLTLLGLLLGRSIQEISEMHLINKIKMTGSQIIAARTSALGIFIGILLSETSEPLNMADKKMTFLAISMLFIVSFVEASKFTVTNKLEQAPEKYVNAQKWLKNTLHTLNLHLIWYCYPIFFAFNLFAEYFSLLVIQICFFYLIFLLQLPSQKKTTHNLINEPIQ